MSNLEKSLAKFKRSLAVGNSYEAQQLVKTVYHRLRSRKSLDESRDLLEAAACLQLSHNQSKHERYLWCKVTCGSELANLLIEAYNDDGLTADEAATRRVLRVFDAYEACSTACPTEYSSFCKAAVQWLSTHGATFEQCERLHDRLAVYHWQRQGLLGLRQAIEHCCRSSNAKTFAEILTEATQLEEGEGGLLAIRAVAHLLTVPSKAPGPKLEQASALCEQLMRQGCLQKDSLEARFLALQLEALGRRSLELSTLAQRQYGTLLNKDPAISLELQKAQTAFCGGAPNNMLGGLFGGMLRSLLTS